MKDDLKLAVLELTEAFVALSEFQAVLAQSLDIGLERLQEAMNFRDTISQISNPVAAKQARAELYEIEQAYAAGIAESKDRMSSALARSQTHIERLQARVAEMRKEGQV